MTSSSSPLDAERLVEHAAWMRRLARRLVSDPATADDVVQETWQAALVSPPPDDRPLRPWLAHVVKNFARRAQRSQARRRQREEVSARPEEQPSTAALVERLEGQRHVVEALLGLDEPYRSTLVARFLDDLSAAEIARRAGLPEGTVRWRVQRGLELLRGRLDGRYGGDRTAWCAALLPWAASREGAALAAGSAVTTAGVLGMKAIAIAAGAASVGLCAVLGWSVMRAPEPPAELAQEPAVSAAPSEPASAENATGAPRELAADVARAEREELAAGPAVAADASDALAATPVGRLHVRFVDAERRPIEGVEFALEDRAEDVHARSNATGVATLQVPVAAGSEFVRFRATREGYEQIAVGTNVRAAETTWLGDVELAYGGRISGRVTDGGGRPVAGAVVDVTLGEALSQSARWARLHGPLGTLGVATRSATDGRYELAGVPAGRIRVWAHTEATRYSHSEPVDVLAGGVTRGVDLELAQLADEDVIEGLVVDPTGAPLPEANVGYEYKSRTQSGSGGLNVDAEGRFRMRLGVRGSYSFWAGDPERRYGLVRAHDVAAGTRDLVLRLGELSEHELFVHDARGRPIERFGFRVHAPGEDVPLPASAEHGGGRAPLFAPDDAFEVTVVAGGYRTRTLGPFAGVEGLSELECELREAPGVRGRILSAAGPVAGARVGLHEVYGEQSLVIRNGFRMRFRSTPEVEATTDADGRFLLSLPSDGEFFLRADAHGFAADEWGPFAGEPGPIELVLGPGGAIEGRVLVPRGEDPTGTIVGIHRGDGHPRTLRVGPDGTFAFAGLTPGPWEVRACEQESSPNSISSYHSSNDDDDPWPWVCDVYEGETTFHDLDLRAGETCVLLGSVDIGDGSSTQWVASLWRRFTWGNQARAGVPSSPLAPDGTFRIEVDRAGTYLLRVEDGATGRVLSTWVRLGTGENPWSFDYPVAELAGSGARPVDGRELAFDHAFVAHGDGVTVRVPLPATPEGTFHVRGVPALPGNIVRWAEENGSDSPTSWSSVAAVEPRAGAVTRVTLP